MLLGFPRRSPEWELSALAALMKPQLKDAILHRPSAQFVPREVRKRVEAAMEAVAQCTGYRPTIHWPDDGDYVFLIEVAAEELAEARGLAVVLSRQLIGGWLVLGRTFLRDGRFFRRERGVKLKLVAASNVHLTRPIRAALNGVL